MKKSIVLITIVLIFIVLVSCGKSTKNSNDTEKDAHQFDVYESYVCDMANDGLISEYEKTWWTGTSIKKGVVNSEKYIKIDEIDFEGVGKYTRSRLGIMQWQETDYYQCDDDVKVGFRAGEFCNYHKGSVSDELNKNKSQIIPYDVLLKTAKEIAGKYIDTDAYILYETTKTLYESLKLYSFEFVRHVNGYRTSDRFLINITEYGTIRTLSIGNIEKFNDVLTENIVGDKVNASLDFKLESVYSNRKEQYSYDVIDQTLTYSPEGDLIVVSQIEVHFVNGINTGVVLSTVIE